MAELEDARKELDDGWNEYYDGVRQYNSGVSKLNAGRRELQQQEAAFQDGLTQFRNQLPALGLPTYGSNSELLSAMAGEQGAVIDGVLNTTRNNLSSGIQLLDGIAKLESQLGDYANVDTSTLTAQKSQLESAISALQSGIQALEGQLPLWTRPPRTMRPKSSAGGTDCRAAADAGSKTGRTGRIGAGHSL